MSASASLPYSDALPYYDRELEDKPGLRAKVEREIEAEIKRLQRHDGQNDAAKLGDARLPEPPLVFKDRTDLAKELERVGSKQDMDALDRRRYQLAPPPAHDDDHADANDASRAEAAWRAAVQNAETQLMYAEGRLTNVELLKRYGANLWRLHNFQQEALSRRYDAAAERLRSQTQELNRQRKRQQTDAGQKLSRLESRWAELVSKNLTLEVANLSAENEVEALEAQLAVLQERIGEMDAQAG